MLNRERMQAVATAEKVKAENGLIAQTAFSFIPQSPTPRQKLFLDLKDALEVFYGGAAGGGKSSALLMAALEYVDVPGYAALLMRRTYADLSKPGALMDRAHQWLQGKAHWSDKTKTWTFPSGATLTFGYLDTENDKYQYQSSEFQFIGFDELSQFTLTQFTYLYSRLRRLKNSDVPVRMRAGSNPGGQGAAWVKERYIPDNFTPEDAIKEKIWRKDGEDEETGETIIRYFIPARIDDNPHLDQAEYELSLRELDPVTRAQLRRGDWQISVRGDILYMWDERYHVITWSQFEKVFGSRHIPFHWKLGIFQDWGATPEHPCATGWFATAAQNTSNVNGVRMAGAVFHYRSLVVHTKTAREVKKLIRDAMTPHNEISRTELWKMSHERLSERLEYWKIDETTDYALPFSNWQTGKTRGVEQLKNALTIRETDKPNPFNPDLFGHPSLYIIVDDNERFNPQTDAGMVRIRQEAPAYKWATPKSGEAPATLVPYALFNDAMDYAREAAVNYFPTLADFTREEKIEMAMPDSLKVDIIGAMPTQDMRDLASQARLMERKKIEKRMDAPVRSAASGLLRRR